MRRLPSLLAVSAALLGLGCHWPNAYEKFFVRAGTKEHSRVKDVQVYAYTGEEALKTYLNAVDAVVVGRSRFLGTYQPTMAWGLTRCEEAVRFAKKVGADVVLLRTEFSHSQSGYRVVPETTGGGIATSMGQHTGTLYAYGPGGSSYGTYSGTSTTFTRLPEYTTYHTVPYTHHFYNHYAVFVHRLTEAERERQLALAKVIIWRASAHLLRGKTERDVRTQLGDPEKELMRSGSKILLYPCPHGDEKVEIWLKDDTVERVERI